MLVNNATQTLTDPISAKQTIQNKLRWQTLLGDANSAIENGCQATVIGDYQMLGGLVEANGAQGPGTEVVYSSYTSQKTESWFIDSIPMWTENDEALIPQPSNSSWAQSLETTPYEDIISGHSVNTSVPLILVRELLPLMGQIAAPVDASSIPSKPLAYIINVSSREGDYESSANSGENAGHHVGTNMSKAGLHMIAETEAAACWKSRHEHG